jgi:hypothetical protein
MAANPGFNHTREQEVGPTHFVDMPRVKNCTVTSILAWLDGTQRQPSPTFLFYSIDEELLHGKKEKTKIARSYFLLLFYIYI